MFWNLQFVYANLKHFFKWVKQKHAGTPNPDVKGKTPFTLYSGFTPGTSVFTHYIIENTVITSTTTISC